MRKFFNTVSILFFTLKLFAQATPNMENSAPLAAGSQLASKLSAVPVNLFTGVPSISVPVYQYNNSANGLSLGISIEYYAGGTQVQESPSILGLNWFLNAGGQITRIVRGMPDDIATYGYMYASSIPTDYRSNGDKYYYDSLDAEQDIFQFSFNGRSGQFLIGKNGQIVSIPSSKLKITSTTVSGALTGFRIIAEDGIKYDFNDVESTTISVSGPSTNFYNNGFTGTYNTAWHLSRIIAPFGTDTIKFNYYPHTIDNAIAFPQETFVRMSDGVRTATYAPTGDNSTTIKKLSSISFPNYINVSLVYGVYTYSGGDTALSKIKVSDTTFRYGYTLTYSNTYLSNPTRLLLTGIAPYTPKSFKDGYMFFYNSPQFPEFGSNGDTLSNKRDYWGYYNGIYNGTNLIPSVNGYTWGANRNPDSAHAIANSLNFFYLPGGGYIQYQYELNDHLPYTKDPHSFNIAAATSSQTALTLSQVFNSKHQLTLTLDTSVSRQASPPISGTGNYILTLKNSSGTLSYLSDTISLYNLFYLGMQTWNFNLPNGSYRLDVSPPASTTLTGTFPIIISWENRLADTLHSFTTSGGLRVKRIYYKNANDDPASFTKEFKYVTSDGKSSGFLGDIPKYDYNYRETVNYSGSTTTNYDLVSSEPLATMNYAQGSTVGYSRVIVYKGTSTHNSGSEVYEFTSLSDLNTNIFTPIFPYGPNDLRNWGLGLPKKVSDYDSLGNLVKRTVTTYAYDSIIYNNSNFLSLKLGLIYTIYNGNPSLSTTPKVRTYVGQQYYVTTGRIYPTSIADTLYQTDGSINASTRTIYYDSNYNVNKIVSSYDRNRGLLLEKRIYYPYNYTISGSVGKLRDSGIIAIPISTENWITGDANPRIFSGSLTSFKQLSAGYIKPDTIFLLQSNQPIAQSSIGIFDASHLNRNYTYFVPQVSYTSYDNKANPVQVTNLISGVSNSMVMDYHFNYPIAKVSNATQGDIAYTSFEADGTGGWTIASSIRDTAAITGLQSYNLSNGSISKSSLNTSQTYILSFWAKSTASITVNGSSVSSYIAQQRGWNLYFLTLTGISTITISGSGVIDELRLHPKDANMVTTSYTPLIGATSEVDANNTIIYSEYDNLNRLKLIRDKDKNILKRYDYSDSVPLISISANYTSDNIKHCTGSAGHYQYRYTDTNPYSDTYLNSYLGTIGTDCVACPFTCSSDPMYKQINCVCEYGNRCNTSTTYMKVVDPNTGLYVWKWRCIYHYEWSDGSHSVDYTEYNDYACGIGCP